MARPVRILWLLHKQSFAWATITPPMTQRPETAPTQLALDLVKKRTGLPLSMQMHEMPGLSGEELLTLSALASPLIVWRGRLCYEYDDRPEKTTLEPSWILYHADECGMTGDLAEAANALTESQELIALPEVHFPTRLESFGQRLNEFPKEASDNFQTLDDLYSQLMSVEQLRVTPFPQGRLSSPDTLVCNLSLPVMFRCPSLKYADFFEEYSDDLTRLRHALRDLYKASQKLTRESAISEITSELDYQIAKLNILYSSAARARQTAGAGVILGCIITAISFAIPAEIRPYLLALGAPSTMFAGLKWLGQPAPDVKCRSSDYYMAWKFQTQ